MKKFNIDSYGAISMREFLSDFVGLDILIDSEKMQSLSKATHRDIKELALPYVKAVPFDTVTEEQILSGEIIIVADGKSNNRVKRYAPYCRPELVKKREEEKEIREERRMNNG